MCVILKIIKLSIAALSVCVIVAWLVGQILSDRYTFSQWLLWIPTQIVFALALTCSALSLVRTNSKRSRKLPLVCWLGITLAITLHFILIEHRFIFASYSYPQTNFKVIHFNANTANDDEFEHFNENILAQNADLIVLTNSGHRRRYEALTQSYKAEGSVFRIGPFRIFSRFEAIESRPIVSNRDINVVLLRIDTKSKLGNAITVYAVDLPSDPKLPRMQIAQKLRAMLNDADAPLPDIVLGDFNMTRRGAALKAAFPDLVHAYSQAGHGYGATFPRRLPLFHIDHILLAQTLQAQSYELINPHAGRHRMQVAEISTKP